ncbi:hypothetical protein N9U36_02185 [Candidatus Pelagibacter sp.]|nr:hypothetical protein [Candidatus Pelagibacter sp.]
MSSKFGIIIQARIGSKRLYGKSIKKIGKVPILIRIVRSIRQNNFFKNVKIVIATTNLINDNKIIKLAKTEKVQIFRGSENNVLERYYEAAKKNKIKNILRLTSDNPFVNIIFLRKLVEIHLKNKNDYTSSKLNLPIGIGAEIMNMKSLRLSYKFAKTKDEKEHVCDYILNNANKFKIQNLEFKYKFQKNKKLRLTVDTEKDLKFCRLFFKKKLKILNESIYYDSYSN